MGVTAEVQQAIQKTIELKKQNPVEEVALLVYVSRLGCRIVVRVKVERGDTEWEVMAKVLISYMYEILRGC